MKHFISFEEIAERLQLSRPTVMKYLKAGKIGGGAIRAGQNRCLRTDFERWWKEYTPSTPVKDPLSLSHASVYFVQHIHGDKPIKIGFSSAGNLPMRLRTIACYCAYPVKVLLILEGGKADERKLHKKFKADRLRGEWFRPSENLKNFLKSKGVKDLL